MKIWWYWEIGKMYTLPEAYNFKSDWSRIREPHNFNRLPLNLDIVAVRCSTKWNMKCNYRSFEVRCECSANWWVGSKSILMWRINFVCSHNLTSFKYNVTVENISKTRINFVPQRLLEELCRCWQQNVIKLRFCIFHLDTRLWCDFLLLLFIENQTRKLITFSHLLLSLPWVRWGR